MLLADGAGRLCIKHFRNALVEAAAGLPNSIGGPGLALQVRGISHSIPRGERDWVSFKKSFERSAFASLGDLTPAIGCFSLRWPWRDF
jgi:hypothetical protein